MIVLRMPEDIGKASLLLRVIAKVVDFLVIATAIKTIPQVGYFAGLVYLLIGDGLFDGRSLGKKLIGLKVVSLPSGKQGSVKDSIVRNVTFFLPLLLYNMPLLGWLFIAVVLTFEFLLMLGNAEGLRLGDDLANTKVIEG